MCSTHFPVLDQIILFLRFLSEEGKNEADWREQPKHKDCTFVWQQIDLDFAVEVIIMHSELRVLVAFDSLYSCHLTIEKNLLYLRKRKVKNGD